MKKLSVLIVVGLIFVMATDASATIGLSDDFESYPINDWPSLNWVGFGGNDSDHSENRIV